MNEKKACCFLGHRKINETQNLKNNLYEITENLITSENVDTFFFGSKSDFNTLCLNTVTKLREKYPHIRRIYVRSSFPDISDSYKDYLLENYEETYFPEKLYGAGKAVYIERNKEMIDKSDFCVVYYDKNYAPPKRSRRGLTDHQPKSGTKLAYEYAVKKNKRIINVL